MGKVRGGGTADRSGRAGWYPDPASRRNQRYWDGHRWTAATRPDQTMSPWLLIVALALFLGIWIVLWSAA